MANQVSLLSSPLSTQLLVARKGMIAADDGPGIDATIAAPRLTRIHSDQPPRRNNDTVGLGLPPRQIARHITHRHGGGITLDRVGRPAPVSSRVRRNIPSVGSLGDARGAVPQVVR